MAPVILGASAPPYETPEGPNVGRILSIAVGAEIRDGRLVIVDSQPGAQLGLTATMVPFAEHNDPNRQLMGVNMMRQCYIPPDPEPALVQTGNEPDVSGFWYGRNVLTAFVSWGVDTFEDAIVISESCAKRFNYPYPVEPGDKFANRHGTKGCITRILPDDEMPHLPDGRPVELVYSFDSLHHRMYFGQIREAVMGLIAWKEGRPAIVPPFRAPSEAELRERLKKAGLPEDGMTQLTMGKNGKPLERRSLVGYVYWECLVHIAREKIRVAVSPSDTGRRLGNHEYPVLRDLGAFENLRERFNTCAVERVDASALASRISAGEIAQAGAPSPQFSKLAQRLSIAGIRATLDGEKLTFQFARPSGQALKLARPIPHPWLLGHTLSEVGVLEELPEYQPLAEVNARLARMIASDTPESLTNQTLRQLQTRAREYFDALVHPSLMRFDMRSLFSGRAVIEPEINLRCDQAGLPEEMAWELFAPFVARALGDAETVRARNEKATQALDELMARSWVIVYPYPPFTPTSFLAFHPVRLQDNAVHLDPIVCPLMNADFDGDQVAVFLPVTQAAQREAGELLSVAAHLSRDPSLLEALLPRNESMWGLAYRSLTPEGRKEIAEIAGVEVNAPDGCLTKASLKAAMQTVLAQEGVEKTLERLERLMQHGFALAKASGASMSPFIGETLKRTPPEGDDPAAWAAYTEAVVEQMASRNRFDDNDLGPQLLAVKSGARGRLHALSQIVIRWSGGGFQEFIEAAGASGGAPAEVKHGYRDGLTPDELRAIAPYHWEGLASVNRQVQQFEQGVVNIGEGFNALTRAMRAQRPGVVFASAAAIGEVDRLLDVDSRMFVGLPG
jgi:hypothetical protein